MRNRKNKRGGAMAKEWYYSKDGGDRKGPVTSKQLKELAASGELDPTDLVWAEGRDEWKPASGLKGLFPQPSAPPKRSSQPPSAAKATSPKSKGVIKVAAGCLAAILIVSGITRGLKETETASYGKLLKFNGVELYYTSTVTVDEANRLGSHLVSSGFSDGSRKTVQLNKTENTYEFRAVLKKGRDIDQRTLQAINNFCKQLSVKVFGGSQVVGHLCDEKLKTIHVVVDSP